MQERIQNDLDQFRAANDLIGHILAGLPSNDAKLLAKELLKRLQAMVDDRTSSKYKLRRRSSRGSRYDQFVKPPAESTKVGGKDAFEMPQRPAQGLSTAPTAALPPYLQPADSLSVRHSQQRAMSRYNDLKRRQLECLHPHRSEPRQQCSLTQRSQIATQRQVGGVRVAPDAFPAYDPTSRTSQRDGSVTTPPRSEESSLGLVEMCVHRAQLVPPEAEPQQGYRGHAHNNSAKLAVPGEDRGTGVDPLAQDVLVEPNGQPIGNSVPYTTEADLSVNSCEASPFPKKSARRNQPSTPVSAGTSHRNTTSSCQHIAGTSIDLALYSSRTNSARSQVSLGPLALTMDNATARRDATSPRYQPTPGAQGQLYEGHLPNHSVVPSLEDPVLTHTATYATGTRVLHNTSTRSDVADNNASRIYSEGHAASQIQLSTASLGQGSMQRVTRRRENPAATRETHVQHNLADVDGGTTLTLVPGPQSYPLILASSELSSVTEVDTSYQHNRHTLLSSRVVHRYPPPETTVSSYATASTQHKNPSGDVKRDARVCSNPLSNVSICANLTSGSDTKASLPTPVLGPRRAARRSSQLLQNASFPTALAECQEGEILEMQYNGQFEEPNGLDTRSVHPDEGREAGDFDQYGAKPIGDGTQFVGIRTGVQHQAGARQRAHRAFEDPVEQQYELLTESRHVSKLLPCEGLQNSKSTNVTEPSPQQRGLGYHLVGYRGSGEDRSMQKKDEGPLGMSSQPTFADRSNLGSAAAGANSGATGTTTRLDTCVGSSGVAQHKEEVHEVGSEHQNHFVAWRFGSGGEKSHRSMDEAAPAIQSLHQALAISNRLQREMSTVIRSSYL